MAHSIPLPFIPTKPRPPMSQRNTARYSYQTATTGFTSPTPSGDSFWGGVARGIRKSGMDGVEESTESGTIITTPSTSPQKEEQTEEKVQQTEAEVASDGIATDETAYSPAPMTTDFRALRLRHFEGLPIAVESKKKWIAVDNIPSNSEDSARRFDTPSPIIALRSRKRSVASPSTPTQNESTSPPFSSLQSHVPSPSVSALAGSNIVLDRINRFQETTSLSVSGEKRSPRSRRVSYSPRKTSLGVRTEMTPSTSSESKTPTTTPRRIRPPRLDAFPIAKPPSPTLQRVGTTASARKMIGMFESLPNTPARGEWPSARKALEEISEGRGGSTPSSATLQHRGNYLSDKPLPPIETRQDSLFPPVLQSTATERAEAPTLLSAWSPHGKMPIKDDTVARPISIPNSPSKSSGMRSSPGKSLMSRSPMSKSPLKEIIGAFAQVKAKMGSKKADEEERRGGQVKGRQRSETVSSWSGGIASGPGILGAGSFGRPELVQIRDAIKPAGRPIKEGQMMYLIPTPCSSMSPWGTWVSGRGALYSNVLQLEHQDETGRPTTIPFNECLTIRSVKDEEIAGRGIPAPGVAAVIELEFDNAPRRYLAAVDFLERSGWITTMLNVKMGINTETYRPQSGPTYFEPVDPMDMPQQVSCKSTTYVPVRQRLAQMEKQHTLNNSPYSANQPAVSPILPTAPLKIRNRTSMPAQTPTPQEEEGELRGSVRRLFAVGPDGSPVAESEGQVLDWVKATKADSVTGERKEEWVPAERELSIFGLGPSRAQSVKRGPSISTYKGERSPIATGSLKRTTTVLSFDANDLNPSRSASRVTPRVPTIVPENNKTTLLDFPEPVPTPKPPQVEKTESSTSTTLPVRRQLPSLPDAAPGGSDMTAVMLKLDTNSGEVASLKDLLQRALDHSGPEVETILRRLEENVAAMRMDVKGAHDLSASNAYPPVNLTALEAKLEDILLVVRGLTTKSIDANSNSNDDPTKVAEEAAAAKEVTDIMSGTALHTVPTDMPGNAIPRTAAEEDGPKSEVEQGGDTQVSQIWDTVKSLQESQATQAQHSSAMAEHLQKLNGWLDAFVTQGTTELQTISGRLDRLVSEIAPAQTADVTEQGSSPPASMPALLRQMHVLMIEQKERAAAEAVATQRIDALIGALSQNKASQEKQQAAMDGVMSLIERQRQEHETLLRALATDLTSEIRGERLRFVEAMREATNINVHMHVEQFKKSLTQEIAQHSNQLTQMQEQKNALELVISDLFAIKAKHTSEPAIPSPNRPGRMAQGTPPSMASPARGRPLPLPHH